MRTKEDTIGGGEADTDDEDYEDQDDGSNWRVQE